MRKYSVGAFRYFRKVPVYSKKLRKLRLKEDVVVLFKRKKIITKMEYKRFYVAISDNGIFVAGKKN